LDKSTAAVIVGGRTHQSMKKWQPYLMRSVLWD